MINRQDVDRSINQLISCVVGRARAKASNHLEDNPTERIEFCSKLIHREVQKVVQNTDPGDLSKALTPSRIQLDSLQSLKTLNQLINEVEW